MPNRSPWEPSWRSLAGTTVVLFAVILAFLAGRVRAGADPGLRSGQSVAPAQTVSPDQTLPPSTEATPEPDSELPSQPDFGGPQDAAPDTDPPTTHVS